MERKQRKTYLVSLKTILFSILTFLSVDQLKALDFKLKLTELNKKWTSSLSSEQPPRLLLLGAKEKFVLNISNDLPKVRIVFYS